MRHSVRGRNASRTHLSLGKDAPERCEVHGRVVLSHTQAERRCDVSSGRNSDLYQAGERAWRLVVRIAHRHDARFDAALTHS